MGALCLLDSSTMSFVAIIFVIVSILPDESHNVVDINIVVQPQSDNPFVSSYIQNSKSLQTSKDSRLTNPHTTNSNTERLAGRSYHQDKMFLINAYRAHRLEKKRERLLKEAYARRASESRHAGREHRHNHREQQDRRNPSARPKTAPNEGRHGARHQAHRNPFETDSLERLPLWLDRAQRGHDDEHLRYGNVSRFAPPQRAVRHQHSDRAMPDIEPPYPRRVDSLPKRAGPANYHPRHGHRYLRPDEHMPPEVIGYVQPLSYGGRAPGETNGYRGRLFREGGPRPARPAPRREKAPQWVGPRPDGWI